MSDRPIILTILAILAILGGLILIAGGAIAYTMSEESWLKAVIEDPSILDSVKDLDAMHAAGLTTLITGLLMLIVGISLFVGWSIAWYIAVILLVISIVMNLYNMISSGLHTGTYAGLLGIVVEIIIIAYLMSPKVRSHFGVSS